MFLRWGDGLQTMMGVMILALVGAGALQVARAAEWVEPSGIPPTANPPGFVWTRDPADPAQAQVGGQFNISGSGRIGGALDVLGKATLGELCMGGECKQTWAGILQSAVQLQAATPGAAQTGNLNINGTARVVDVVASGNVTAKNVKAAQCLGPVFLGRTVIEFQGNQGGYVQVNTKCNAVFPGSHVCSTAEALNSINCGAFDDAGLAETDMWISNLAPSMPTPTNDCIGWTTADGSWRGTKWRLNPTTGGAGYAEQCSKSLSFACCG